MLAKRIIPCLDVDNGRVVKGVRFVSLVDAGDPVEQAKRYDLEGADELTFLDITASSDRREIVVDLVRRVADEVFIPFTVGGGLRTVEDIRAILRAGADKVTLNTAALEKPDLVSECAEMFGSQCIVVAVDARRRQDSNQMGWDVYTHVQHMETTLRSRLRDGLDRFDALASCFPAGTVTGAPKIRAMEIIRELEPDPRGIYAGAVLYMDYADNLDSCIAIRTMMLRGEDATVQAGAGIVADSVPEHEYAETVNKARAMFRAIEMAERGL